jgi:hypothetical protein
LKGWETIVRPKLQKRKEKEGDGEEDENTL